VTNRVGIIDYGMGNLFSVKKAFERLNQPISLVKYPSDLDNCDALILPGVGAFDPAMQRLKECELVPHLKTWHNKKKPLLGICLGLQLLFQSSEEGQLEGLGLLEGKICKLPKDLGERIPHMGWALLNPRNSCPLIGNQNNNWVYFVHSYSAIPTDPKAIAATTNFGEFEISSMVWENRLGACQFHPEKSGKTGQKILSNWLKWLHNGAPI
tara:strand:- start:581 stop:1213 length:633 start_codon:yes stop_codon:yes gene_type:complete